MSWCRPALESGHPCWLPSCRGATHPKIPAQSCAQYRHPIAAALRALAPYLPVPARRIPSASSRVKTRRQPPRRYIEQFFLGSCRSLIAESKYLNCRRTADDFRQFLRDSCLTRFIVNQRQFIYHVAGIIRRCLHCHHAGRLLGCHVLGQRLVNQRLDIPDHDVVNNRLGLGFVNIISHAFILLTAMRNTFVLSPPHKPLSDVTTTIPIRFTVSRSIRNG